MHPDVADRVRAICPDRIVHVSCNPDAVARDLVWIGRRRTQTSTDKKSLSVRVGLRGSVVKIANDAVVDGADRLPA